MDARLRTWLALGVSLTACFGAAAIGQRFTAPALVPWYAALQKPAWTPPTWLFGPVWSLLYAAMAVAAWLVWRQHSSGARLPLTLFGVQLGLNVGWTILFFGLRNPGAAFVEIVVLWCAIAATLASFWRTSRVAGLLLVPYLAWVTYAGALNYAIWRLNEPGA